MNYYRRISQRRLKMRLDNVDPTSIEKFSYKGIITYAKVYKVYDGDTVKIIFEYRGELIKYSCRIFGIDTPEIRTKDLEEKRLGYLARDFLSSFLLNKVVKIELFDFDKYGRLLAKLYINVGGEEKNISDIMISEGYAKPYFGGTK